MKIQSITPLSIPEIKIIGFSRFMDHRGYFTEIYNLSEFKKNDNWEIQQINESFSKAKTIRGLHFQWNPYMGKLVRTIHGHFIDLVLDIRLESPTFGKIIAYDMPTTSDNDFNEWIWVPQGFAHGTIFLEDTIIQYLCSGHYSPHCESVISPFSNDIDWSLCDVEITKLFNKLRYDSEAKITEKDRNGLTVENWKNNINSQFFKYKI